MTAKGFVAALIVVGVSLGSGRIVHAEQSEPESLRLVEVSGLIVPMAKTVDSAALLERPAAIPALYVSLAALQALDVYSTTSALKAGAREANPTASPFAGNTAALIGLKAATTAGTIFFAERLWKKNKVGAIVMLAAINGATAAVSVHNIRNTKLARATIPAR